eukprot:538767-Ditylum_brightwellii.AAC.1
MTRTTVPGCKDGMKFASTLQCNVDIVYLLLIVDRLKFLQLRRRDITISTKEICKLLGWFRQA